jgi:hypothetical protein
MFAPLFRHVFFGTGEEKAIRRYEEVGVLKIRSELIKIIGDFIKESHERGDKSFMVSFRDQMDASVLHAHGSFFLYKFAYTR